MRQGEIFSSLILNLIFIFSNYGQYFSLILFLVLLIVNTQPSEDDANLEIALGEQEVVNFVYGL